MARRTYKFTDKKHSRQGIMSTVLGILSLILMIITFAMAFETGGNAGDFAGLWGLVSFLCAGSGFVLAIRGFREEEVYYLFSKTGVLMNAVLFVVWMLIFIMGM